MDTLLQISATVVFGIPFIAMIGVGLVNMLSPKTFECKKKKKLNETGIVIYRIYFRKTLQSLFFVFYFRK